MQKLIIISITLIFSSIVFGKDTYTAPKFKIKNSINNNAHFEKNWKDENHYKLSDSPEKLRDVASSPQENKVKAEDYKQKRDPSSISSKIEKDAKVKGWDILPTLEY